MLRMRLKLAFGSYPADTVLEFECATSAGVLPGDIVLTGLNDETLFPHLVTINGDLTHFGSITGERRNIRYRATATIALIHPL